MCRLEFDDEGKPVDIQGVDPPGDKGLRIFSSDKSFHQKYADTKLPISKSPCESLDYKLSSNKPPECMTMNKTVSPPNVHKTTKRKPSPAISPETFFASPPEG